MRYFSLFTGIGGFENGINQAYVALSSTKREEQRRLEKSQPNAVLDWYRTTTQPVCVGYSEIDKYAIQIYQKHFPNHKNYGDITKIDEVSLPDFDLLVGGFPCQSFSIAGKRAGFGDTRGTLFFDIARIVKQKQPRLLLLENVKGLLSHDDGRTFYTIISTLDELGYDIQWQVLNSKNFGVPQNRERVFIVGHLRGTPRPQVFPITGSNPKGLEELTNSAQQGYRVYSKQGINPTLASQAGGVGAKTGLIAHTIRGGGRSSGLGTKQNWDSYLVDGVIRRLTPKECERLQGFPDDWTKEGVECCAECQSADLPKEREIGKHFTWCTKIISDTQRYKTLGNAVTTNVVQAIMEKMLWQEE